MRLPELKTKAKLKPTIIIIMDPQSEIRGYSLLGKEFFLKDGPQPAERKVITLDGVEFVEVHYIISRNEYLRVVPQAVKYHEIEPEVCIPVYFAQRSFRPEYVV